MLFLIFAEVVKSRDREKFYAFYMSMLIFMLRFVRKGFIVSTLIFNGGS